METKELLLTSSRYTQQWSACLYDPISGNILHYYKNGGIIASKCLNFIGKDYLVTSDEEKPLIHVWLLNSQEPIKKLTTILPEKAQVLVVCPKSTYIAAGIGVKLYLWHISSGKLFSVQKRNYQPISCVKFSSDGAYLIIGGQDGMLLVYNIISLLSFNYNYLPQSDLGQVEPLYTKQDHSMPILDIYLGAFGAKSRIASVSSDQTCKIYDLASGQLLLNLVFNEPLTSIIFDAPCWNLYVGTASGKIQQFYLKEPPRSLEHHVENNKLLFEGHSKRINCLDLNILNTNLVSGSDDNFVFIWEISSRQILRRIEHKSGITNVRFVLNYANIFVQNLKPKYVLKTFDRDLNNSEMFIESRIQDFDIELSDDEDVDKVGENSALESENSRLRVINKQLYDAALQISKKYNNF